MIFQSNRTFRIWAYSVSHESLVIRSLMTYEDQEDYNEQTDHNIDLEFWGVSFINLPSTLPNLGVKLVEIINLPEYINRECCQYDEKAFEITGEGKLFYVLASSLLIGKYKWFQGDRIFDVGLNLKHDEIIAFIPGK